MERLSVRLTDRMFLQLDALAEERGVDRTRLVRQLLEAGLRERPAPPSDTPSEEELLALLTDRARAGNVAAIRSLLLREEQKDPRAPGDRAVSDDGLRSVSREPACVPGVQAIGPPGPEYRREVALVAKAIRESGDEEALVLFGVGAEPHPDPAFDREAAPG